MKTDIQIAQEAVMEPISMVAERGRNSQGGSGILREIQGETVGRFLGKK